MLSAANRQLSGTKVRRGGTNAGLSLIALFGDGDFVPGSVVKRAALLSQHASVDGQILAISFGDEFQCVDMARFEIHLVDIVTAGAVDDPSDLRPDRCHRAHAAGLQRRVERRTAEFSVLELPSCSPDGLDLGMGNGVMVVRDVISFGGDDFAIHDDDAADRRKRRIGALLGRHLERFAHELSVTIEVHRMVLRG